jgi:hypothetical protein
MAGYRDWLNRIGIAFTAAILRSLGIRSFCDSRPRVGIELVVWMLPSRAENNGLDAPVRASLSTWKDFPGPLSSTTSPEKMTGMMT